MMSNWRSMAKAMSIPATSPKKVSQFLIPFGVTVSKHSTILGKGMAEE